MEHRQAVPVGPWAADFPCPWAGRSGWFGICLVTLGHVEPPLPSPSFIASSQRAHSTFLLLLNQKILQLNPIPVFYGVKAVWSDILLYLIFTSSLNFLWSQLLLLHFSFSLVQQESKKIGAYSVAESCKYWFPLPATHLPRRKVKYFLNTERERENLKGASPKIRGNKEDREILVDRIWFTGFEALWLSMSCHFAEQQFSSTPAQKSCLDCPFHLPGHQETAKCRNINGFLTVGFTFIGKLSFSDKTEIWKLFLGSLF